MPSNKSTTPTARFLNYLLKCQSGVVAIEMAFIGPFMLLLYFGLLDLTFFMTENRKTIAIAGSISDLVGQHRRSILEANLQDYMRIGTMIMKPGSDQNLAVVITNYRRVGGIPTAIWSVNNGKNCENPVPSQELASLMELNNDVIVAQACTQIRLYSGKLLTFHKPERSDFLVENFVMVRPRVALTLECYTNPATVSGPSTC